jgi:hypothetical protein
MLSSELASEKLFDLGNIFKIDDVRLIVKYLSTMFVWNTNLMVKFFQFKSERLEPITQKQRQIVLSSDLASEKLSDLNLSVKTRSAKSRLPATSYL